MYRLIYASFFIQFHAYMGLIFYIADQIDIEVVTRFILQQTLPNMAILNWINGLTLSTNL